MRMGRYFWGIFILLVGLVLLLVNLGLLVVDIWAIIFPLLLIMVGVWFLLGPVLGRNQRAMKEVALDLNGAAEAEVELNHGGGSVLVHSAPDSTRLMAGSFAGGLATDLRRDGSKVWLKMSVPGDAWMDFPFFGAEGFRWDVGFNQSIPLRLRLKTGAGEANFDLHDLQVREFVLETGASSSKLTLPAQAGYTRGEITSGVASVNLIVPEGVAARIHVKGGLAGIDIDRNRFPQNGSVYESADFETAANKADIFIETGVGSVSVR